MESYNNESFLDVLLAMAARPIRGFQERVYTTVTLSLVMEDSR